MHEMVTSALIQKMNSMTVVFITHESSVIESLTPCDMTFVR